MGISKPYRVRYHSWYVPEEKEFRYLKVLFTSDVKMEGEMERWFVAASTVLQALSQTIMVKRALNRKTKNLIYQLIYISTLTYGHEL